VAMRDIRVGEEITINYGPSYWKNAVPGVDPVLAGEHIKEPFTDCIYYNGILEDFQCTAAPGGFLIPPHANKKRKRMTDILEVRQVPESHPAYPGFGLYAKKKFSRNDTICLYAGIVDMSPFSARHTSKYAVDMRSDVVVGPFGFHLDTLTLRCQKNQSLWPFVVGFTDISSPCSEKILSGVKCIGDLSEELSRKICDALFDEDHRELIRRKVKLCDAVSQTPTKKEYEEWEKKVKRMFTNPFKPLTDTDMAMSEKAAAPAFVDDRELIVLLGD
jgi:hypothetical protein